MLSYHGMNDAQRQTVDRFVALLVNALISTRVPVGIPDHKRKAKNGCYLAFFKMNDIAFEVECRLTCLGEIVVDSRNEFRFLIHPGIFINRGAGCYFNGELLRKLM